MSEQPKRSVSKAPRGKSGSVIEKKATKNNLKKEALPTTESAILPSKIESNSNPRMILPGEKIDLTRPFLHPPNVGEGDGASPSWLFNTQPNSNYNLPNSRYLPNSSLLNNSTPAFVSPSITNSGFVMPNLSTKSKLSEQFLPPNSLSQSTIPITSEKLLGGVLDPSKYANMDGQERLEHIRMMNKRSQQFMEESRQRMLSYASGDIKVEHSEVLRQALVNRQRIQHLKQFQQQHQQQGEVMTPAMTWGRTAQAMMDRGGATGYYSSVPGLSSLSSQPSSQLQTNQYSTTAPQLVVNEAYLRHLKVRFPLAEAHRQEVETLARQFPNLNQDYYLFDKIGEGTFSSVYKGVDIKYDLYENNSWDLFPSDSESEDEDHFPNPPPALIYEGSQGEEGPVKPIIPVDRILARPNNHVKGSKYKLVAVKKIYVTSSCVRIENEIEILHRLSGHPNVVSLITAVRSEDQIIAITPYYKHHDFRETFSFFTYFDMQVYMRCLLKGLAHCHRQDIIHRDVKPSNFLYHITKQRGQLADFGLAQKEELPPSPKRVKLDQFMTRPMHQNKSIEPTRQDQKDPLAKLNPNGVLYSYIDDKGRAGILRNDNRASIRANRAGTRGFRAPEVLFKVVHQTKAIDIWSAGVILLCMLTRRFPFFNSPTDHDALVEIGIIYGRKKMRELAKTFDRTFDTNVPSVTEDGITYETLIKSTNPTEFPIIPFEAIDLLRRLMELDPNVRITAEQALHHPFLSE